MFKKIIKKTFIINIYHLIKKFYVKPKSQSNESKIIKQIVDRFNVFNTFIEFGFSGYEFNCALLANEVDDLGKKKYSGLLIDADPYNKKIADIIFDHNIVSKHLFLTLDTLDFLTNLKHKIGILSIDIDGNEYWFLEKLISLRPDLIICEFNIAFGLLTISTPYDPNFDWTKKHESWLYHGASITALNYLLGKNNYSLIDISSNGVNAFFVRNDLITPETKKLIPEKIFRVKVYPDGSTSAQNFELIKHMPFVDVTNSKSSNKSLGEIIF
jgi:hypothetical protein